MSANCQMDVSSLLSLSITDFLSQYNLDSKIEAELSIQGITSVEMLLECDVNDIIVVTKSFENKEIEIKDKIKFRSILKGIITQIENQVESDAHKKKLNNAGQSVVTTLTAKDHALLSQIYSKPEVIDPWKKLVNDNIESINKMHESNANEIENYFGELIELITKRKNDILNKNKKICQERIAPCNEIKSKLSDFESLTQNEIRSVENEINNCKISSERQKKLEKCLEKLNKFESDNKLDFEAIEKSTKGSNIHFVSDDGNKFKVCVILCARIYI